MSRQTKRFIDDGFAVWIDGDDRSTVYLNSWITRSGVSYIDIAIRIYGTKDVKTVNFYVPFAIKENELIDLYKSLNDTSVLCGLFNMNCRIDTNESPYTSEIKYRDRVLSLISMEKDITKVEELGNGSIITIDLTKIHEHIKSDESYIIFRLPHKSINELFEQKMDATGKLRRFVDLITSPVVTQKYGYSIRINEARVLPEQINQIEVLHTQRLKKVIISMAINEDFEVNDANCYRIRRLERVYKNYTPDGFDNDKTITYQWLEERDKNMTAHYNFYFSFLHSRMSANSLGIYLILFIMIGALGSFIGTVVFEGLKLIFG